MTITLKELRRANEMRDLEWDPTDKITPAFRTIELGGEVGELLNVMKKRLREDIGLRGSRASLPELGEEFADVLICLDLLAMEYGIDLEEALRQKFNATSKKYGLGVLL